MKVLKMGTTVVEIASDRKGHLDGISIGVNLSVVYKFIPNELNKGGIQHSYNVYGEMIKGAPSVEVDLPVEVLGSMVTDIYSGFTGMAVQMAVHLNGCVHFWVQGGNLDDDGTLASPQDLSILQLTGKKITKKTLTSLEYVKTGSPKPITYTVA